VPLANAGTEARTAIVNTSASAILLNMIIPPGQSRKWLCRVDRAKAKFIPARVRSADKFTQSAQACLRSAALLTMRSKKLARRSN
jgi:hypothetical protein